MLFDSFPSVSAIHSLRDINHSVYWLDNPANAAVRPAPGEALFGVAEADLLIIGAGFTGLWAAQLAQRQHPDWRIVIVEGGRVANAATGRNGGFVSASLTHGFANGMARWPSEMPQLLSMGKQNLASIAEFITDHQLDCDFMLAGEIDVAVEEYQVGDLQEAALEMADSGLNIQFLTEDQVRARVNSPTYRAGLFDPDVALVDPARLAWELSAHVTNSSVTIFENTPVSELHNQGVNVKAVTPHGAVNAARVILATNAFPPLLKRIQNFTIPVYDYVLVSEPLSAEQRASIGWQGREGLSDRGNQFHYYRTTSDGRILWGGFDASYYSKQPFARANEQSPGSHLRLARHFFQTFPQLEGLRFEYAWGGAIDTCSRFTAFWGMAHQNKTAYVSGYTGLGVGASRFAAQVMLDLLEGERNERTELAIVRSKPIPFPPEPLRSIGIAITQNALQRADSNQGKRNLWLRTLDGLGMGFDSATYNDGSWKSGGSQLGFGDGDEKTVVGWGTNATKKHITTYFRTTFDAGPTVADVTSLSLRALVDDGAIVYLNGTEVWRFNLPTGTISNTTRASRYIAGAEEQQWRTVTLPKSALRAGANTIAVEVHQDAPSSSDLSMDLELSPKR